MENKKAQLGLSIINAIFIFIIGMLIINFLMPEVTDFRTNMDCSNYSGISDATKLLCLVGDVVTSTSYAANSIKLMAYDKGSLLNTLVAWVNGWKILVQGSNSADENNIITLNTPPTNGNRIDFVFLEVWRKLIYPTDTIYQYGNVL
jgi:hypothetical protein